MNGLYRACQVGCACGLLAGFVAVKATMLGVESAGRQLAKQVKP